MPQEIAIAVIAAGAALAGSLLAVLVGLVTANISRRTTVEDRQAATDAEIHRWKLAQSAEHETWLRNKKQEFIAEFLRSVEQVFAIASRMNAAHPRKRRPEVEREAIEAMKAVGIQGINLMSLDSLTVGAVSVMLKNLRSLVLFLEERPGDLTPEINAAFLERIEAHSSGEAVFVALALLDLGISHPGLSSDEKKVIAEILIETYLD